MLNKEKKIAVIGLGYVGLPLAIELSKKYHVLGFDIDKIRIDELLKGYDRTGEANLKSLKMASNFTELKGKIGLTLSSNFQELKFFNIYIITVPTPINKFKSPDLSPLLNASKMIGKFINKGDTIIYESTVYPGCTEDDCVPILERSSGLKFNTDFFCGYSPERINPGDKINILTKIKKVT